ncbi:hypothetical protein FPQ18DRAFT_306459 [Pyronema domesticum]|nr:hypothetical protein FPQ18DRAFT_306459 [Pyronema domesticum]
MDNSVSQYCLFDHAMRRDKVDPRNVRYLSTSLICRVGRANAFTRTLLATKRLLKAIVKGPKNYSDEVKGKLDEMWNMAPRRLIIFKSFWKDLQDWQNQFRPFETQKFFAKDKKLLEKLHIKPDQADEDSKLCYDSSHSSPADKDRVNWCLKPKEFTGWLSSSFPGIPQVNNNDSASTGSISPMSHLGAFIAILLKNSRILCGIYFCRVELLMLIAKILHGRSTFEKLNCAADPAIQLQLRFH